MSDSPSHPAASRLRECAAFYEIPFTPVPVKARHDGWTAERQRGFVDRLVVSGCVARSARAVGKTPQSAYRLRDHPQAESFRRAWDEALKAGRSYQLDIGIERGLVGERVPVTYRGRIVGERVRHDNRLVLAVLNAMDRRAPLAPTADPIAVLNGFLEEIAAQRRPH